jgi:hypothetical protein
MDLISATGDRRDHTMTKTTQIYMRTIDRPRLRHLIPSIDGEIRRDGPYAMYAAVGEVGVRAYWLLSPDRVDVVPGGRRVGRSSSWLRCVPPKGPRVCAA